MPTTFVTGDLFFYEGLDALAHGCNCAGAMGKGIAKEFKRRFPEMYEEYRSRCRSKLFGLGDVFMWSHGETLVFNLGTQRTWRSGASLEAINTSLARMIKLAEDSGVTRIGLPRVGAGLGGLPWSEVRQRIERAGATTTIELVVFENDPQPG